MSVRAVSSPSSSQRVCSAENSTTSIASDVLVQEGIASQAHIVASGGTPPALTPLLPIDEARAIQEIGKDWEAIHALDRKVTERIIHFHEGKHMRVFEHALYPGLILKTPSQKNGSDMLESLQNCQNLVREHQFESCIIPSAQLIEIPERGTLFVMEKVDGTIHPFASQEESERAFEQFDNSPALKEKWLRWFEQAARFICLVGYWDCGWQNILLTKKGLAFIDFESVYPCSINKINGITSLLEMAPLEFFDTIVEIAKEYDTTPKPAINGRVRDSLETVKRERAEDLAVRTRVRRWHETQNITGVEKLDGRRWPGGSFEYKIVQEFNERFNNSYLYCYQGSLVEQRKLTCQPLMFLEIGKKPDLECALGNLRDQGIVCTWQTEELNLRQPELIKYSIYF